MVNLNLCDLCSSELERDIIASLEQSAKSYARASGSVPAAEAIFSAEMADVTQGIERKERFDLLKRFIAHGCLLPSWEKGFQNSKNALDDVELADCIDFVTGHMVSKFQGKLTELLAAAPITDKVNDLMNSGLLPPGGSLAFGSALRCMAFSRAPAVLPNSDLRGVEGPDAVYWRVPAEEFIEVCLIAEIKSYQVTPKLLRRQSDGHLRAIDRGLRIQGTWYAPQNIRCRPGGIQRIYVCPSDWSLTRHFTVTTDPNGTEQISMDEQTLPDASQTIRPLEEGEWMIRLAWSHDAVRAAAFGLMLRYMRGVGEALAADPKGKIRQDMSPAEAGENDFLSQLHVAIVRQMEGEPDARRRMKTIDLYNVLGFGWALGHGFRDKDGNHSMLFYEDLREIGRRRD